MEEESQGSQKTNCDYPPCLFAKLPPSKAAKLPQESRSKKEIVLKLLRREEGATIAEIAKATDWQNHSIRGFISAQVGRKRG